MGYDPNYGARPLKRAIRKELENPLGQLIVQGKLQDGRQVSADYDESAGQLTFDIEVVPETAAQYRAAATR